MTFDQALAFAIIGVTIALFIWDRVRYDVVAAARAAGGDRRRASCPTDQAFTGFSDQIVIIVASALVVSAGVGRSGVDRTAAWRRWLAD